MHLENYECPLTISYYKLCLNLTLLHINYMYNANHCLPDLRFPFCHRQHLLTFNLLAQLGNGRKENMSPYNWNVFGFTLLGITHDLLHLMQSGYPTI